LSEHELGAEARQAVEKCLSQGFVDPVAAAAIDQQPPELRDFGVAERIGGLRLPLDGAGACSSPVASASTSRCGHVPVSSATARVGRTRCRAPCRQGAL
jgi:hypothetical protein